MLRLRSPPSTCLTPSIMIPAPRTQGVPVSMCGPRTYLKEQKGFSLQNGIGQRPPVAYQLSATSIMFLPTLFTTSTGFFFFHVQMLSFSQALARNNPLQLELTKEITALG